MVTNTSFVSQDGAIKKIMSTPAWRLTIICLLGFASGLPLALTGQAMQAWLTVDGVDIATIGFLTLVGLPYTFKFLWAPLMDRFEPKFFGRRRGWLVITQLAIACVLVLMSGSSPSKNIEIFGLWAVLLAFLSASQDVVIDAYRTDVLHSEERGLGSSLAVFGYRFAMILSGGISFLWADAANGMGWSWPQIYVIMAIIMGVAAVISFFFVPAVPANSTPPKSIAKNDIIGFFAVLVAVVIGYQVTAKLLTPMCDSFLTSFAVQDNPDSVTMLKKWSNLLSLLLGVGLTLPLAWLAAKKAKFETLNLSLANYFSIRGAMAFLAFIILYKLGDAFAGSLTTPFLIKSVGFSQAEIGVVNKVIGMWLTIIGALFGGALMMKLGLYRSLFLFGVLQLISNLGFWLVAVSGKGAWGSFLLPSFDIVIVSLKEATQVDWMLMFAVAIENLTGGMGTAAFVAFLMALCNQKFTATQYALLSAFASIGRVWVGPLSGVLSESIGWSSFFIFSAIMAVPGLIMLRKLKEHINILDAPKIDPLAED